MRRLLLGFTALAGLAAPGLATAGVDWVRPIASVCAMTPGGEVSRQRLAEAFLAETGVQTADVAAAYQDPGGGPLTAAGYGVAAMDVAQKGQLNGKNNYVLKRLVQVTEERLAPNSQVTVKEAGLKATGSGVSAGHGWLFDSTKPVTLTCAPGDPPPSAITALEEDDNRAFVAIRSTVDELPLVGKAAREAGAFKLGFKREESLAEDGTKKTDRTTTIDGTVGLRLSRSGANYPIYLYGSYALSEARTKPPPPLDPGAKVEDGDTDVLEYGLHFTPWLAKAGTDGAIVLAGQIANVKDYVKDSERLKGRLSLTYGDPAIQFGSLCRLGAFLPHAGGFRTRCRVLGEVEGSHVFDKGTADFKEHGEYLSAGGSFSYDIAAPVGDSAGIIATATYRYLPTISGSAPDIKRFDASLKYRLWLDNGIGLDLGLNYAKGEEAKSYKDEDKLELGIGVVF